MNEFQNARLAVTDLDLRQFLKVLKKWKLIIIGLTLLAVVGTGVYNYYILPQVYQARTLLMITMASEKLQAPSTNQNVPVLTMTTYLEQLKSETVMNRVLVSIDLPGENIGSLAKMVSADIIPDSNLIDVRVANSDPVVACSIANALSDQYIQLTREYKLSSVVVISPASIPTSPIKPNKEMNTAFGFMGGLIAAILLAFLLEYMDNTVKTSEDVARVMNLPVLGLIPVRDRKNTRQS